MNKKFERLKSENKEIKEQIEKDKENSNQLKETINLLTVPN